MLPSSEACNRKAECHPDESTSRGRHARPHKGKDRNPKQTSNNQTSTYALHDELPNVGSATPAPLTPGLEPRRNRGSVQPVCSVAFLFLFARSDYTSDNKEENDAWQCHVNQNRNRDADDELSPSKICKYR